MLLCTRLYVFDFLCAIIIILFLRLLLLKYIIVHFPKSFFFTRGVCSEDFKHVMYTILYGWFSFTSISVMSVANNFVKFITPKLSKESQRSEYRVFVLDYSTCIRIDLKQSKDLPCYRNICIYIYYILYI